MTWIACFCHGQLFGEVEETDGMLGEKETSPHAAHSIQGCLRAQTGSRRQLDRDIWTQLCEGPVAFIGQVGSALADGTAAPLPLHTSPGIADVPHDRPKHLGATQLTWTLFEALVLGSVAMPGLPR